MATIPDQFAMAVAHHQGGRLQAAAQICRQIVELAPRHAEALHLLGVICAQTGDHQNAIEHISRAVAMEPAWPVAHASLGNAFAKQGSLDEAIECYHRALQLNPDFADAHNNLGHALRQRGKVVDAVSHFQRALQLKPDSAVAHNNLGNAYRDLGRRSEAVACYHRALEIAPDYAGAHSNLGTVLGELGRLDEAVVCLRRAVELSPDYAQAHSNLGNALKGQRKLEEAIACFRRALELKPGHADAHSSLLHTLHYCPGVTLAALAQAHADFGRRFTLRPYVPGQRHQSPSDSHGRLRVGFVSPDLGAHPVGYCVVRALENLDQDEFETFCYSDRILEDDLTHRIQAAATHWRKVYGMSDQRLAEHIQTDEIDILFDLAGHTANNRLAVFAMKPAPVQVTWFGYVGTTGLPTMDYILADRFHVPPESDAACCEQVLRMPDAYVCYDPPGDALPVSPLPALVQGYVTFGSFNNPLKLNRHVTEVWASVLRSVPQSRLVLKYKGLSDPSLAKGLVEEFVGYGIDPSRLNLLGGSRHAEMLAEYAQIDLALDPFPYSGGTTTCEALWMGVPVVTCPGETFASRHSLSYLSNAGLIETIAKDLTDYVDLSVSLAGDLPRLAALRSGLRERMAASPLCNGRQFGSNFAKLLRHILTRSASEGVREDSHI